MARQGNRTAGDPGYCTVVITHRADIGDGRACRGGGGIIAMIWRKARLARNAHIHDCNRGTLRLDTGFDELNLVRFGIASAYSKMFNGWVIFASCIMMLLVLGRPSVMGAIDSVSAP